jgi:hypothetical protein
MIDEEYHRYILAYNAGHDTAEPWRRRTYLATASRPEATSVADEVPGRLGFRISAIAPNPGRGDVRIEFLLPEPGRLAVTIYSVTGRLVADLGGKESDAGTQEVLWDRTADGTPLPSGVYLVSGILESEGEKVAESRGRVVVLR